VGTNVIQNMSQKNNEIWDHAIQVGDSAYDRPNAVINNFLNTTPNYQLLPPQ